MSRSVNRLLRLGASLAAALLVVGLALVRWAPIEPAAYAPAPAVPLAGPLAPNRDLVDLELLGAARLAGPEDVEPLGDGSLLTGNADGSIRRLTRTADGWAVETFGSTGGRPLGLDRDTEGLLWVADSERGLVAFDRSGQVVSTLREVASKPLAFADDVATRAGRVYLSDASGRHGPEALFLETLEARPWGRLIEHDPQTGDSRVLLDRLYFANGVEVAEDGSFVLVAETFRYRIRRHWLTGPRAGETEIFVDRLPGFPDGVSSDGRGGFWVAIHSPRVELLDRWLHPRPWLKRLLAWLPESLRPRPRAFGMVLALDGSGRVVDSLQDPAGEHYPFVTSVEEHEGHLYLGSVEGDAVGRVRVR